MIRLSTLTLLTTLTLFSCSSTSSTDSSVVSHPSSVINRWVYTLDLKNDSALIEEYKRIHTPEGIWPEIPEIIKESGITDLEIFLLDTRMFMIIEAPADWDQEAGWKWMDEQEINKKWQEHTWEFQKALPFAEPGEKWIEMEKVFDLDRDF